MLTINSKKGFYGFNFRGLAFKQSMMILAAITVVFGLIFGI